MTLLSAAPIFTVHADLGAIARFGETPYGERRVIDILGGRVEGAKLSGRVLSGGADWQIIRRDGAADIKARYTIEADNGARILVDSVGLRHGPAAVMERLSRGEAVDASAYYFRTAMRFETADPAHDWMNRIIALARGARAANAVRLDVFEVV